MNVCSVGRLILRSVRARFARSFSHVPNLSIQLVGSQLTDAECWVIRTNEMEPRHGGMWRFTGPACGYGTTHVNTDHARVIRLTLLSFYSDEPKLQL